MNPEGRIEKLNQAIRAFAVVILLVAFCAAFLTPIIVTLAGKAMAPVVSTEAFLVILNTVLVWWFKSRDEQQRRTDLKPPTNGGTNGTTPSPAPSS
jgi:NADH:ubiquinone oxidoreductase subunit 3 (subunit A)